jgi:hypothetical protein
MKTIDAFVDVGTPKFVILPIVEPATPQLWEEHLEAGRADRARDRRDTVGSMNDQGPAFPKHAVGSGPIDLARSRWCDEGWTEAPTVWRW